ncbi:hypothetical protein ACFWPH_04355 [Nocardia sp. NPDC058499]|uniref:hypothetical protein n=1 Tax=Nocardia sp. NPDC058499 TaxID=3346530 RepID=UPI00366969FF
MTRVITVGGNKLVTRSVSVRARHRRSEVGHRRWDVLLGAAFTTVLVAFPLGPGATAAAYSGGPVVAAQSSTGDTAEGRDSTGTGEGPTTPAAVAACGGSGSASGSGSESPWSGSAELAAGSASGSACTVVPALGELLRTLIRLAPKIAPPCPCPNGRK